MGEELFTLNESFNDLLIDPDGLSALLLAEPEAATAPYITTGDVPIADLTSTKRVENVEYVHVADQADAAKYIIPSISTVVSTGDEPQEEIEIPEMNLEDLNNFRLLCSSGIFCSSIISKKILATKLFSRIFMIPINPNTFDIDVTASRQTESGNKFFNSKELKDMTEEFETFSGPVVTKYTRLKRRSSKEGRIQLNEFFVTIGSVTPPGQE